MDFRRIYQQREYPGMAIVTLQHQALPSNARGIVRNGAAFSLTFRASLVRTATVGGLGSHESPNSAVNYYRFLHRLQA